MPPTRITILDLSAYVGLLAVGAVTLNVLLGLLMALRYSPHRSWPHHRFNYFRFTTGPVTSFSLYRSFTRQFCS